MASKPIILGLTGSTAMGKSTIARHFMDAGVACFDTDAEYHRLLAHGGKAVSLIAQRFPTSLVNGKIDRNELKQIIVADPTALKTLEDLTNPILLEQFEGFAQNATEQGAKVILLNAPLLFEFGWNQHCNFVAVANASSETQRQRLFTRPNMTEEWMNTILQRQMPQQEQVERADFVINTEGDDESVKKQVSTLIERLQTKISSMRDR